MTHFLVGLMFACIWGILVTGLVATTHTQPDRSDLWGRVCIRFFKAFLVVAVLLLVSVVV